MFTKKELEGPITDSAVQKLEASDILDQVDAEELRRSLIRRHLEEGEFEEAKQFMTDQDIDIRHALIKSLCRANRIEDAVGFMTAAEKARFIDEPPSYGETAAAPAPQ